MKGIQTTHKLWILCSNQTQIPGIQGSRKLQFVIMEKNNQNRSQSGRDIVIRRLEY